MIRFAFYIVLFSGLLSCSLLSKQGIVGQLDWVSGNQMPGPDKMPPTRQGVMREVQIYELLNLNDVEIEGAFIRKVNKPIVKTTFSDKNGLFKVNLPSGAYSILIKVEGGLFANQFDQNNNIQHVIVKEKGFSRVTIKINYKAAY
ncbi:MAG: carboxypeptidase regulatory-like domain-containing protein [Cyclobacteriaceae bacterium]